MFTEREIRSIAVFLPLAVLVVLGVVFFDPKVDPEFAEEVEQTMERIEDSLRLRMFDPNEVEYEELREMGLGKYEAVSLIKFRTSGKVFRIKEDVALCHGISDSLYSQLAPYILIGEAYRLQPHSRSYPHRTPRKVIPAEAFRMDTVTAIYLQAIGALSRRQAEALIRWRDVSGIYSMEDLKECYVVSDSVAKALEAYVIFPEKQPSPVEQPVEINTADSTELCRVVGIGSKTARAIIEYRQKLGGFYKKEQISEVKGVTERNFEKILKQISCKSCEIQKIDINFASPNRLAIHPYIAPRRLRKLLKQRQLKGGWSTTEELLKDDIFTEEELEKLAPYLDFSPIRQSNEPENQKIFE